MFERYTVKARRTIFFSRHEAMQHGSTYIETEHLLLGLLHEDAPLAERLMGSDTKVESLRALIDQDTKKQQSVTTATDLPLSDGSKRVLAYAAEEAERLAHRHIGTEHLLLGLLREKNSLAAKLLSQRGLRAEDVRSTLAEQPHESPSDIPATSRVMRGGVRSLSRPDPLVFLKKAALLRSIRIWLGVVILGLFLSGVTAFPLQHELALTLRFATHIHLAQHAPALNAWFLRVYTALADVNARYPFLAYGTDWLAFAHLVIAVAFIGPYLDPVRNKWFITWGFISCAGVIPLALIAGPIRGIPFYWRCIDCSFGVFCCLCLLVIRRSIQQLGRLTANP